MNRNSRPQNGSGNRVGFYVVELLVAIVIIKQHQQGMILEKGKPPRMAQPPKMIIPSMYANAATSGLTSDMEAGDNTLDFELGRR